MSKKTTVDKLWASGKGIFKNREEIFEDDCCKKAKAEERKFVWDHFVNGTMKFINFEEFEEYLKKQKEGGE